MAKQDPVHPQPFSNFPCEAVRQRLDQRLRSRPVQNAIRQSLSQELGTLLNAKTLNATVQDLVTGRTNLDQSLQQLATTASRALDRVMKVEQQQFDQESRINQEYLAALQQNKTSHDRKKNYVVLGQVLNEHTQEPLAGLLVQATDRDMRKDDFLGLAITDQEGRFEIRFGTKDFEESGENLPEVMLEVGIDRQTMLFKTDIPLIVRPQESTTITLVLPTEQAETAQRLIAQAQQSPLDRVQTVNRAIAFTQYQHLQAQAIGNALKT